MNDNNETAETETMSNESNDDLIGMPTHPLKSWGEMHRRKTDETVCTKCGDDKREYNGESVCPACLTRGDPDRYQRRHYMDIEELVEG